MREEPTRQRIACNLSMYTRGINLFYGSVLKGEKVRARWMDNGCNHVGRLPVPDYSDFSISITSLMPSSIDDTLTFSNRFNGLRPYPP